MIDFGADRPRLSGRNSTGVPVNGGGNGYGGNGHGGYGAGGASQGAGGEGAPDVIALRRVVLAVRRHPFLVLGVLALCLGAAYYFARQDPRLYRATSVVRLTDQRRALTDEAEAVQAALGRSGDPLLSLLELIHSRTIVGHVVDSLGLALDPVTPGFTQERLTDVRVDSAAAGDTLQLTLGSRGVQVRFGHRTVAAPFGELVDLGTVQFRVQPPKAAAAGTSGGSATSTAPTAPAAPTTAAVAVLSRPRAVDRVLAELTAVQRTNTDVVDVSFTDPDPVLAQHVANAIVVTFYEARIRAAQDASRRRRIFLADQLRQTDSLLSAAQGGLSAFRSQAQLANSSERLNAAQTELGTIASRAAELEADRRAYRTLLDRLQAATPAQKSEALRTLAALPDLAADPAINKLRTDVLTTQTRLDSATTGPWRSAATNPDVIQLRALAANAEGELVAAVRGRVATLDARIAALRDLQTGAGVAMRDLPALQATETRLQQRVTTLSALADQARSKYEEARMDEAVGAGDAEIVDLAPLPNQGVWTAGIIKMLIGFMVGLLGGVGLAVLREETNRTIRRPEEVEQMLHLPGLAVIPRVRAGGREGGRLAAFLPGRGRRPRLHGGNGHGSGDRGPAGGDQADTLAASRSIRGEAFRMLRTNLLWSSWGHELRSVVVTSVAPGDGKTLTAANLAAALAGAERRVLLVDGDLRRPRLHRVFGMPRGPGFADLLRATGASRLDEALRATSIDGLTLLPCGTAEPGVSDLLAGPRAAALLGELTVAFDLVVVDAPPVLAAADASTLAVLGDGVLLVLRAGQTDRAAAQRACQQLAIIGANVVGAILNDPQGEVARAGRHYYPYAYDGAAT